MTPLKLHQKPFRDPKQLLDPPQNPPNIKMITNIIMMEQEKHSIMYKKSRVNGSQSGGLSDCAEVALLSSYFDPNFLFSYLW